MTDKRERKAEPPFLHMDCSGCRSDCSSRNLEEGLDGPGGAALGEVVQGLEAGPELGGCPERLRKGPSCRGRDAALAADPEETAQSPFSSSINAITVQRQIACGGTPLLRRGGCLRSGLPAAGRVLGSVPWGCCEGLPEPAFSFRIRKPQGAIRKSQSASRLVPPRPDPEREGTEHAGDMDDQDPPDGEGVVEGVLEDRVGDPDGGSDGH